MGYRVREVDGTKHTDIIRALQDKSGYVKSEIKTPADGQLWWIVYHDKEPVGCAALLHSEADTDVDLGILTRAAVLPEHWGKGLQRRLIRVRTRAARKLGWQMCVSTTYNNPVSANNLIACGFRQYTPATRYMAEGTDYWLLRLGR